MIWILSKTMLKICHISNFWSQIKKVLLPKNYRSFFNTTIRDFLPLDIYNSALFSARTKSIYFFVWKIIVVGKDKTSFILFLELCKNYGMEVSFSNCCRHFWNTFYLLFLTKKTTKKQRNHQNGGTFNIFDMNILGYC